jgi:hypothetical protein
MFANPLLISLLQSSHVSFTHYVLQSQTHHTHGHWDDGDESTRASGLKIWNIQSSKHFNTTDPMGSKRFIVFGNPPTLQQLRSSSISSRDTPTWQTRTVYHSTSQAHHQSAAKKRSCTTEPLEAKSRQERSSDPGHRHPSSASQPSAVLPNLASVSVVAGHSQHPGDITTSSESLDHSQGSRKRPKLQWQEEHDEVDTDRDVSEGQFASFEFFTSM